VVNGRISGIILDQKKSDIVILFIGQNVEKLIFVIENNLRDGLHVKEQVNVDVMHFLHIDPKSIKKGGHSKNILTFIGDEVTWLNGKLF
jgi:hypothetical protein